MCLKQFVNSNAFHQFQQTQQRKLQIVNDWEKTERIKDLQGKMKLTSCVEKRKGLGKYNFS